MLEGIGLTGNNYISAEKINDSVFNDEALKRVEIVNDETKETEILENQTLVQNIEYNGEYWFIFREKGQVELLEEKVEAQAEVITALTETIEDLQERVEELEGETVLYESGDIELEELGATIGQTIDIESDITVMSGSNVYVKLTDMTVDGEPIEDAEGLIYMYGDKDWDWQGGELYSDVFGNGAYFAFGTKPMDAVANKVTLGFVNEAGDFDTRYLHIGHIKVTIPKNTEE